MPKDWKDFIVTTWETVEGTYVVSARDEGHAMERIEDIMGPGERRWNGIKQLDYMAFEVTARKARRA